jgi:uncharacterized membrane protein YeaQ/YmgE (transglycosylase-associated protein family)
MSIITTIVIGFLVGLVARLLKPGRDPAGFVITILIGIAGAFIATVAGRAMGWYDASEAAGFIASVIGAIVLLVIFGLFTRNRV